MSENRVNIEALEKHIHEKIRQSYAQAAETLCKEISDVIHSGGCLDKSAYTVNHLMNEDEQMVRVSKLLRDIGFNPALKGFKYIAYAVVLSTNNPDCLRNISKCLYAKIAEKHCASITIVERAIRHAISSCVTNMSEAATKEIFGNVLTGASRVPSNARALSSLVDYAKEQNVL